MVFSGSTDRGLQLSVFDLLKQICARKLRLACDCNANGANRPEISCRSYHGGQSFGLAKMPNNEKRPDHAAHCPFNRQVKIRIDTAKRGASSEFDYSGRFALPVVVDVTQAPSDPSRSSPARHNDHPKLMRMFAKLMDAAGFSHLASLKADEPKPDIHGEFDRLLRAARTFHVSDGITLQRVFSKSFHPREHRAFKQRVDLRFQNTDGDKARIGFLGLYTKRMNGRVLEGPSGKVEIESDPLLLPGLDESDFADTPSLSLIFYGAPNATAPLKPLRAAVLPVYSGQCFTPVPNDMARQCLRSILGLRYRLQRTYPDLAIGIDVPLERTILGSPELADITLNAVHHKTGEIKTAHFVLKDERYLAQAEMRQSQITEWRNRTGCSVWEIDEAALSNSEDLRRALTACIV